MNSDDDIYDDSDADNFEDDGDSYTGDTDHEDDNYEPEKATKEAPEKNCTTMSPDVIRQKQEENISSISNVLALSRASAISLLLHYNWCVPNVQEEWFADEEKVRKVVGLFDRPTVDPTKNTKRKFKCGICFDEYRRNKLHHAAGCSHLFCQECWQGFIGTSVNDGPACLRLRCPNPSCNSSVGEDMIKAFACDEDKQKYSSYLLRSYIEDNKYIKWCPAPDCGLALNFIAGSDSFEVTCECINSFCWKCDMEAHRPVDCSTMEKWILKNSTEAENVNWIRVNSKPCPNCKRPIEKTSGCHRMTCSMCRFQFCWFCLGSPENEHACNSYQGRGADYDSEETKEAIFLEKYTHYYERWEAHHTSLDQAVKYTKNMQTHAKLEELFFILCLTDEEQREKVTKFIKDAWLQIIECRRLLKWSYTYGYYLSEHEHAKTWLFEHVQGLAESDLEGLHRFAEEGLQNCLDSEHTYGNLEIFQNGLQKQVTKTVNRFADLASACKNGLSEVLSQSAGSIAKEIAALDFGSKVQIFH